MDSIEKFNTKTSCEEDGFDWVFLIYVARSGSTLLSKRLSEATEDVLVFPELKLIESILKLGEKRFFALSTQAQMELIQKDPRWQNLGLEDEILRKKLEVAGSLEGLMSEIVRHIAREKKLRPRFVMLKNGGALWVQEEISAAFRRVSFVHIVRDPRGCIGSRMKELNLYRQFPEPRLKDVWYLSKFWKKYVVQCKSLEKNGCRFIEVKYEDLLENCDNELGRLLNALGAKFSAGSNNLFALGEKEKTSKHANVEGPLNGQRAYAWQEELSARDGTVIELLLDEFIEKKFFTNRQGAVSNNMCLLRGWSRHLWLTCHKSLIVIKKAYYSRS